MDPVLKKINRMTLGGIYVIKSESGDILLVKRIFSKNLIILASSIYKEDSVWGTELMQEHLWSILEKRKYRMKRIKKKDLPPYLFMAYHSEELDDIVKGQK